jgi:hypothetical protein
VTEALHLLPLPRRLEHTGEAFPFARARTLGRPEGWDRPALAPLTEALAARGARPTSAPGDGDLTFALEPCATGPEGYRLDVGSEGVRVVAADAAGLSHGARTLTQLVRASGRDALAGVRVEDAPTFAQRGAMLDVSRDRVPTMETLFALVDRLASWKLNRLQLYVEHTFAYAGEEEVWGDASPLTAAELRALDAYCAARHVELVPNQQAFGHMHRWLVHARHRDLAECPEGVEHPFSRVPEPFSLCPTDPRSLAFVTRLLDELLPCFTSGTVNVGCDETFDLGLGRSRAACEERGVGRVYLEYLTALAEVLRARGKRMQCWADVLSNHPELVPDLVSSGADVEPMLWGYEATHPFAAQTAQLAESGLAYQVCPGTSSWQSLAGRLANMTANIEAAVRHGRAQGAGGVLVTDWGDRGHLQTQPASWPGWIAAADLAWNADAPAARRTPEAQAELVARHALDGASGSAELARALIDLARAGEATGHEVPNASPLSVLLTKVDAPFPPRELEGLDAPGLARARELVETARGRLDAPVGAGLDLARAELVWTADLLALACDLGCARLGSGPPPDRLRARLEPLRAEHRRLWLARSRPGGLARSAAWLERVDAFLAGS